MSSGRRDEMTVLLGGRAAESVVFEKRPPPEPSSQPAR
jgi:ATP-dependent Zn protease